MGKSRTTGKSCVVAHMNKVGWLVTSHDDKNLLLLPERTGRQLAASIYLKTATYRAQPYLNRTETRRTDDGMVVSALENGDMIITHQYRRLFIAFPFDTSTEAALEIANKTLTPPMFAALSVHSNDNMGEPEVAVMTWKALRKAVLRLYDVVKIKTKYGCQAVMWTVGGIKWLGDLPCMSNEAEAFYRRNGWAIDENLIYDKDNLVQMDYGSVISITGNLVELQGIWHDVNYTTVCLWFREIHEAREND